MENMNEKCQKPQQITLKRINTENAKMLQI